ncbi:MAG: hypothetical protein DRP58_02890 [Spirochaetes bacterium]|nr:MAG: hypothetical protein DRP58_02890 [Spirochaetota bacterium]RLD32797.1 MAG: hypothetical protein DRI73_06515 [Bacteroidota bacterium]
MAVVEVKVDPGICGLKSNIIVEAGDMMSAKVSIESDCPDIRKIGENIQEIDSMKDVFAKLGDSTVYQLGKEFCKHGTCPVPGAILKGVEVACGLALPKDVHVEIQKKD